MFTVLAMINQLNCLVSGSSDKPEENAEELSEEDRELLLRAERKKTALEVLHQAEETVSKESAD